ncbi:MAG TPA: trypsin-like peptidase domain-containing protein [Verrucomicrobiae bacterium]|nr:trypsin-like peptidase domain-containing protein [Verrucomicrobiae bacterium]
MKSFCLPMAALLSASLLAGAAPAIVPETKQLDLARQLNEAFVQVADKLSPCVVVIEVTEKDSEDSAPLGPLRRFFQNPAHPHHWRHDVQGEGSGVIFTEDGYILTNNHVVEGADTITVRLRDGRSFTGHVKGADPESDIAVVKIDAKNLPTAILGDSDKTRVGEFVLAIGAPFELSYSVTVGHVSAKGRAFEEDEHSGYLDQDFIQTDASINPGNSGGPLVNLYGEVIGLNAMIEGMNRGIGFAVPINLAKRVKDHLISEGKFTRSWLGIEIQTVGEDDAYHNFVKGVTAGVLVTGIQPASPASVSTLKLGDVIVAVDGKKVSTARELKNEISDKSAGKVVELGVVRDTSKVSVFVKVDAMPSSSVATRNPPGQNSPNTAPESAAFGLTVQPLDKQLARQYGIAESAGIVVTSVEDSSPADDTGIQEGDVITEVNRKPVTTLRQFRDALKAGDPKVGELLNLISKGARRLVVLHDGN